MTMTEPPGEPAAGELKTAMSDSRATLASGFTDVTVSTDHPTGCIGKTQRILRKVYKAARSLVGLIIILIAYSALGAAIFMAIESPHEMKYKSNITEIREKMVAELVKTINQVRDVNVFRETTRKSLLEYESSIRDALKNDVTTDSSVKSWTMWSSLFFVWTTYTTIGKLHAYTVYLLLLFF